jgi:hypothetical protein
VESDKNCPIAKQDSSKFVPSSPLRHGRRRPTTHDFRFVREARSRIADHDVE